MIRDEAPLAGGAVLVRALFDSVSPGRAFDRDVLVRDVSHNFELFGYYGLSFWGVSNRWPVDRVLRDKVRRAERIALFSAGALRAEGLGIVPSGREPHYDVCFGSVYGRSFGGDSSAVGTAAKLMDRLLRAPYTVEANRYYEQDLY